ncbi:Kinesin heavy chain isoform 5C, putative [Perkinsus marinus ATCC 50983]|uniref:Kinesin heavy chain isoform 5C, putative n=1 Tax=Perkinsus marinus (strain ATCC 50983 / TXsc) TaxID=423536 RepID=C5LK58_PERM5|nr:Kinesin heavy chain isoform 5C, putative [Perkinsus marinus ATCC 50983]EER02845.1 Kinesin heavy chain isoform 5C, putative [Perkinsus marinus ATCC 50983]|eukprot:XP_002771029.1 Kinesin heavy chain isoform 5C, putative [Perkinsus marinus ATCC 50983]
MELSVKSTEEEMVQYSDGENELQDKMGQLSDELEGKMSRVHTAKGDVKTAEATLATKEAALQKSTGVLEDRKGRLGDLKSFVANIEDKLKVVNSESAHIGSMLQDARAKQKMIRDNIESKTETSQKARQMLDEREKALAVTTNSLKAHEAALKQLYMGNFDQEKEVQDASELHQHAVVEEKELREKRSELDGYTSQYQSKIESSKRQLDELDRQVDSAVLKNTTLGRIATEIKSRDLKQAEERLTLAQQQLEAAKQEYNAKTSDILRLTQARKILDAQRQTMTNSSSSEADRLMEEARREVAHAKSLLTPDVAKSTESEQDDETSPSFMQANRLRHTRARNTPDQSELRKFMKNPSKEVAARMSEELIEKLDTEVDLALYRANSTVGMIENRVKDLVNEVNYAQKDRDALKTKFSKAVDQSKTAARILAELQKRNDITKKAEKNDTSTYDHLTEQQAVFSEKLERAHETTTDSRSKLQDVSERYEHAKVRQQQLQKRRAAVESAVKALKSSFEVINKDQKKDEALLRSVTLNVTNLKSDYDKVKSEKSKLEEQFVPLKRQMGIAAEAFRQQRKSQEEKSNEVRDAASRLNVEIAALSKAEQSQKKSTAELDQVKSGLSRKHELLEASRKRKASLENRLEKIQGQLSELVKKSRSKQCPEMDIL